MEKIGDSIVHKLIEWVTRLPFYNQLPKEVLTKLLTHKWHELLVLTTSAYQAIHGFRRMGTTRTDGEKVELHQEVSSSSTYVIYKSDIITVYSDFRPSRLPPIWSHFKRV